MTSGAFHPDRLLVDVQVAGGAIGFSFREFWGYVTLTAIDDLVLPFKRKLCGIVIEVQGIAHGGPIVSSMTFVTADLEILTMRGLCPRLDHHQDPGYYPHCTNQTLHLFAPGSNWSLTGRPKSGPVSGRFKKNDSGVRETSLLEVW